MTETWMGKDDDEGSWRFKGTERNGKPVKKRINMQASSSSSASAALWKSFGDVKGDRYFRQCRAASVCLEPSHQHFRGRERKFALFFFLTGSCSAVLWRLGSDRGDSEIISGRLPSFYPIPPYIPASLLHFYPRSGSSTPRSVDQ